MQNNRSKCWVLGGVVSAFAIAACWLLFSCFLHGDLCGVEKKHNSKTVPELYGEVCWEWATRTEAVVYDSSNGFSVFDLVSGRKMKFEALNKVIGFQTDSSLGVLMACRSNRMAIVFGGGGVVKCMLVEVDIQKQTASELATRSSSRLPSQIFVLPSTAGWIEFYESPPSSKLVTVRVGESNVVETQLLSSESISIVGLIDDYNIVSLIGHEGSQHPQVDYWVIHGEKIEKTHAPKSGVTELNGQVYSGRISPTGESILWCAGRNVTRLVWGRKFPYVAFRKSALNTICVSDVWMNNIKPLVTLPLASVTGGDPKWLPSGDSVYVECEREWCEFKIRKGE